jgi:uncharacterized PurR-regulated membrane protein YhhQ (DUF165 family)
MLEMLMGLVGRMEVDTDGVGVFGIPRGNMTDGDLVTTVAGGQVDVGLIAVLMIFFAIPCVRLAFQKEPIASVVTCGFRFPRTILFIFPAIFGIGPALQDQAVALLVPPMVRMVRIVA